MRSTTICPTSLAVLLVVAVSASTLQAASTVAVRSAKIAALARSTSEQGSGGFVGMVPGVALTDPVSISTGIAVPTTIDYGDGTVATYQPGDTPAHTYTQPGLYKPVISSQTLGVVTLVFHVPFNGDAGNVYGLGVQPVYDPVTYKPTDAVQFLTVFDGTATLDFGDGTPTVPGDESTYPQHTYAKSGVYTAVLTSTNGTDSQSGSIRFAYPLSNKNNVGKLPSISITEFIATPNPAKAGDAIAFSAAISSANVTGDLTGTLDFGDGSTPFTATGTALSDALKAQVSHTYSADGVYRSQLTVSGGATQGSTELFVVIGSGSAVNSLSGLISSVKVDATGTASMQVIVSNLVGAVNATTSFEDTLTRVAPIDGLFPSRVFNAPTISVANSIAKDAAGAELGMVRKTIVVGAAEAGVSGALPAPPTSAVKITKLSGKFLFAKDTPDLVSVTGTIQLPKGFDPAQAGGNTLVVGVGNIVDSVVIDAKGKPNLATGAQQRLKKISVKFPKLTGPAAGGEVASISVSFSLPNMDVAGFDTEGIQGKLRADEKHLKTVPRFVQVDLLFAGVPYEVYAPVLFKLTPKGDAGQIANRRQ